MKEERIKEILNINLGVWDKEKAMRVAIRKCEEEIIEIIEEELCCEEDYEKDCVLCNARKRILSKLKENIT